MKFPSGSLKREAQCEGAITLLKCAGAIQTNLLQWRLRVDGKQKRKQPRKSSLSRSQTSIFELQTRCITTHDGANLSISFFGKCSESTTKLFPSMADPVIFFKLGRFALFGLLDFESNCKKH